MKKIAFLILASAFFFSCATSLEKLAEVDYFTEEQVQQMLESVISDSQNDEMEISDSEIPENEIPESESEQESAQNENSAQTSDEIQDEQNADEKIEPDENAQIQDGLDEIEDGENIFAQENFTDENAPKNDSPSSEILPQENPSEIESAENFAQDENARQEKISSEEEILQEELFAERVPQTEQASSLEEFDESENAIAENSGEDANVSTPHDPEFAELNSTQADSDLQTPPATQPEIETPPQPALPQNPVGYHSEGQNQNSGQRQNDAPRQNQRRNVPTDSAQNDSPRNPAPSETGARQNSLNGNSTQVPPTGNSARQNSKNENSSSAESGSEIASKYDFSEGDKNSNENESEEKPKPIPSRSLTLKRNQFVDIIYPGSGWIYLGEEGGDHFTFYGRKQGRGESTFTLRSKKAGKALLHFYKNDALTGKYIDDYIELNVTQEAALDAAHVEAPSYAQAVPQKYERKNPNEEADEIPAQAENDAPNSESKKNSSETVTSNTDEKNGAEQNANDEIARNSAQEVAASEKVQTVIQTSPTQEESASRTSIAAAQNPPPRNENPEKDSQAASNAASLLERAQKAYDEKRYADALDLVRKFLDIATENIDAGIFLEGQILEAKSEVRDIKSAIGSYDTVVKNFPQSKFWTRANEREIYLKRFYINIR